MSHPWKTVNYSRKCQENAACGSYTSKKATLEPKRNKHTFNQDMPFFSVQNEGTNCRKTVYCNA